MKDEDRYRLAEEAKQEHEWNTYCREQERCGQCPYSGYRFARCKASVCDCFEYDWEARHQWWDRFKIWLFDKPSSPLNWHRVVAYRLWGKRRQQKWIDDFNLGVVQPSEKPEGEVPF